MTRSNTSKAGRSFIWALAVWVLLQTTRAIAFTLLGAIDAGSESEAWRYPAYLDLFAVFAAPPLIWALFKARNLYSWTGAVVYLAISIVDHVGNFVTTAFVGPPSIAEGMNPVLVPLIQTLLDLAFVGLLFRIRNRRLFFELERDAE